MHAELQSMVFLKGLSLENDDDGCFVPRKLFLKIEDYRKFTLECTLLINVKDLSGLGFIT